jgi:Na+/H+ antiporter 1
MLHPWVSFAIMPIFAFANAGVSFADVSMVDLFAPLPLGIAVGLFVGKQLGVFAASWVAIRLGVCRLPHDISWTALYGVCLLTGIGFTMSLFIGTLAFENPGYAAGTRLGVFLGSILSGLCGYLLLRAIGGRKAAGGTAGPAKRPLPAGICRLTLTQANRSREPFLSRSVSIADPQFVRCSFQFSGPFPSISASLSPFGCRPSRIASTMSGARQVSGRSRQTHAPSRPPARQGR